MHRSNNKQADKILMQPLKLILPIFLALLAISCGDEGDKTIAQVGSESISAREFNNYLKFKRIPQQDKPRVSRMLDDYLEREAITQQVIDSKYIDPGQVEVEINEFRKQILIGRYFENFLKDKVSDEAVQNYYNSNPDQFNTQKVHVSHILIRTNKNMSENERQALLTKAREAYSKVTSGVPFKDVVKAYSEDTVSAKKDGDLGWIKKGSIDPVFSEKVFSMKEGDITEPFATGFGFHVVKLVEAPQVVKTPFEKSTGNIRYQLRQKAKLAEKERLLKAVNIERADN